MLKPDKRKFSNLRGCDFFSETPKLYRSPNCINMWKDYSTGIIESRPGMTLKGAFGLQIYGLYFYDIVSGGTKTTKVIVHAGTKLYLWSNYPTAPVMSGENATVTTLYTGMNTRESQAFIWNNIFFIKDGINYLEYNGTTVTSVLASATIPITANNRTPQGISYDDEGNITTAQYQRVNLLQPKRKNRFVADGLETEFYLSETGLDEASIYIMTAIVNGTTMTESVDFEVDRSASKVTFDTAPAKPSTDGVSNVEITYSITSSTNVDKILKSTILTGFDKRIFFSGNQDYPNTVFHSELEDPRYIRDNAYYPEGLNLAPVISMVSGSIGGIDTLIAFKEPSQSNDTIYYHEPTIDYDYGKIYPSKQSSISVGCVSTAINFNDDIVFFSKNGLEAINGAINSEKLLAHRSTLVDSKITIQNSYKSMKVAEYKGYLCCLVDSKLYLADSRQTYTNELTSEIEYEWYYWELPNSITYIKEHDGSLFFGNAAGNLYQLSGTTDNTVAFTSKWTTPKDNYNTDTEVKTTNKRGGIADVKIVTNGTITVKAKKDNDTWVTIGTYSSSKGYIVYPMKIKKFKDIQLEFSSSTPFGLISATLEAFTGSSIKR